MLPKLPVVWNGAATRLSFRRCHQGVSINDAAMVLVQPTEADEKVDLREAFPLRGPVFIGDHRTWFHNFAAVGTESDLESMIDHTLLQGEVRTSFMGWNFERRAVPMSCVSCQSITDYTVLKMMLSA
jgi:hypothetical protein